MILIIIPNNNNWISYYLLYNNKMNKNWLIINRKKNIINAWKKEKHNKVKEINKNYKLIKILTLQIRINNKTILLIF